MIAQLGLLSLLAPGLFLLVYVAVRRPTLFVGLTLLWLGIVEVMPLPGMQFGSYSVYHSDLLAVVTLGVGFARFRPSRVPKTASLTAILWASATAIGVLSWSLTIGVEHSAVFWRWMLLAAGFFVYTLTSGVRWSWPNISKVLVVPSLILLIPMLASLAQRGMWRSDIIGSRPLGSDTVLMWLIALFVLLLRPGPWTASRWAQAVALGAGVLLAEHRSVWVAAAVGGLVVILVGRSVPVVVRLTAVGWGVPLVVVVVGLVPQLQRAATDATTWDWRMVRVFDSLGIARSASEWLLGSLPGPSPVTQPGVMMNSAHNLYVSMVEYLGLVGLVGFILLFIAVARRRIGTVPFGLAVTCAVAAYSFAYGLPPFVAGLFGILMTYDARTGRPFESARSPSEDTTPLAGLVAGHRLERRT
ncbi:MAG: hypothetical protein U0904_02045 [Candidatus Nanopelagicales bacterium]|nr:hypothetical protein [Candidatus Nanopelagicales bacterium]